MYIVIEGPDGSGKGTQADRAECYLAKRGFEVVRTIEPGGTAIGDEIRRVLKDPELERNPSTNLFLFSASRAEGSAQIIRPALDAGRIVVADRSYYSTIAYQGYGEGVNVDDILAVSRIALEELVDPDLSVVLDVPVAEIERRMTQRGGRDGDFFDKTGAEYFEKVRRGYAFCEQLGAKMIDGLGDEDTVWSRIKQEIDRIVGEKNGSNV